MVCTIPFGFPYDVEYPIQIHGFDPTFHFVGMTFNPEGFTEMTRRTSAGRPTVKRLPSGNTRLPGSLNG